MAIRAGVSNGVHGGIDNGRNYASVDFSAETSTTVFWRWSEALTHQALDTQAIRCNEAGGGYGEDLADVQYSIVGEKGLLRVNAFTL